MRTKGSTHWWLTWFDVAKTKYPTCSHESFVKTQNLPHFRIDTLLHSAVWVKSERHVALDRWTMASRITSENLPEDIRQLMQRFTQKVQIVEMLVKRGLLPSTFHHREKSPFAQIKRMSLSMTHFEPYSLSRITKKHSANACHSQWLTLRLTRFLESPRSISIADKLSVRAPPIRPCSIQCLWSALPTGTWHICKS